MHYDITTLGELVIDLIPLPTAEGLAFVAKPGGAPGNVAAGVARLGLRSAMISKVGDEAFGRSVVAALAAAGAATDFILRTSAHNTALAVVTKNDGAEAGYIFYRENCADANLAAGELPLALIAASRILHVGTLPLATLVSAAAQRRAIAHAKSRGVLVSTDVNFRSSFWPGSKAMLDAGREMIGAAGIVKTSRDELVALTDIADTEKAVRSLWHPGLVVFAVTSGPSGAELFTKDEAVSVAGFAVETVDTVGCGDAFMANLLASLIEGNLAPPRGEALAQVARCACAAGALVATRSGALECMPDRPEIDAFLAAR